MRDLLEGAFPPTRFKGRPKGSPAEAWGGYLDAVTFGAALIGRRWTELDARFLEQHHAAVSYADPQRFAALLPAWLTAIVEAIGSLDMLPLFVLNALIRPDAGDRRARYDARMQCLSGAQREAVAEVLAALSRSADHADHHTKINAALVSDWGALLKAR